MPPPGIEPGPRPSESRVRFQHTPGAKRFQPDGVARPIAHALSRRSEINHDRRRRESIAGVGVEPTEHQNLILAALPVCLPGAEGTPSENGGHGSRTHRAEHRKLDRAPAPREFQAPVSNRASRPYESRPAPATPGSARKHRQRLNRSRTRRSWRKTQGPSRRSGHREKLTRSSNRQERRTTPQRPRRDVEPTVSVVTGRRAPRTAPRGPRPTCPTEGWPRRDSNPQTPASEAGGFAGLPTGPFGEFRGLESNQRPPRSERGVTTSSNCPGMDDLPHVHEADTFPIDQVRN